MKHEFKSFIAAAVVTAAVTFSNPSIAASVSASIDGSSAAIGAVVQGSAGAILGSAGMVVVSATAVGDGVRLVLRDASKGVDTSLHVSGKAANDSLTWVGQTLKPVVTESGTLLTKGIHVVMFIPFATAITLFASDAFPHVYGN